MNFILISGLLYFTGQKSSSKSSKGGTSAIATFFGILSAFLIIAIVLAALYYLYRRRKSNKALYTVRYDSNTKDTDNNDMKSVPKQLTIENPLYSSDPPTTAISTAVAFDNGSA